ncbi:CC0125/CC1285 family lipoprotein [Pseudoalteromonas umbrosa]|uniref:CC0125/CC1285 family lipoprotein n=1 Tax=Pseudoalteromonas umbrosa TaxID=3048489 RepID=UPI0024C28D35|nr:hypothetical protein [Pseudoalteromonas sp. B95]MDK1286645.1 hypothetical protein [Pseudoalteromonas sp. B95]
MMKSLKIISVSSIILATVGCSAVSYQPMGFRGGYSDTQLNDSTFRVHYAGNGDVTLEKATDFALLRSAVIAQQHGSQLFSSQEYSSRVSKVYAGTPGVYVYKPSVYVSIELNNEINESDKVAECSTFYSMFSTLVALKGSALYTFNTHACIQQLQQKYQLTNEQIYDIKSSKVERS